jgi:hypothetical protein
MVNESIILPIGAGALFHLTFLKNFELERFMYVFLALCMVVPTAVSCFYISLPTYTDVWTTVSATTTGFASGAFLSILVYRVLFDRLRRFPGPVLSKITRFHGLFLSARNTKYHEEVSDFHD